MAETKTAQTPAARPLSPFLIYRWTWTMAMSIAHRVTGVALYGGTLLIAAWLLAAAAGPGPFATAQWLAGSILGRLVLFGFSYALFHHAVGGVRHLIWDTGAAYDYPARMNLARMTPFVAGALTIAVWAIAYAVR